MLARWDGKRRYANLRKLMRLARSYEELRGPDIEGFVHVIRDQEAVGACQLEAVSEEEGADAVRLLTIHAAKGLEFKVVIVADAGRDTAGAPSTDEILVLPDGSFGFRVLDPKSGKRKGVFDYDAVRAAEKREDHAERLRLYYVAMTRAIDRLIVSGAIDLERRHDRDDADRLGARSARRTRRGRTSARRAGRARARRGAVRRSPSIASRLSCGRRRAGWSSSRPGSLRCSTQLPTTPAPRGYRLPELVPPAAAPLHRVRGLSYSALALFERCSYRYYAERVAGLREERGSAASARGRPEGDRDRRRGPPAARARRSRGARASRTSSRFAAGTRPSPTRSSSGSAASSPPTASRSSRRGSPSSPASRPSGRSRSSTTACSSTAASTCSGARARRALVLDYKTNSLAEGSPDEIVEADYRLQRLVYALACFRAGAEEVEVVYHFLERPDAVVSTPFERLELPRARGRAVRGDRADQCGRVPSDPERLQLLRLPGARPRLRRPAARRRRVAAARAVARA